MRYGKLTQTAWNRSVGRQLHTGQQSGLYGPSPFETCSGWSMASEGNEAHFVWAEAHASGKSLRTGYYAVLQAAGELAAKGVIPSAVSIRILFPPEAEEADLKGLTTGIQEACGRMDLALTSLQGETTFAAACTTVFVTAAGISGDMRTCREDAVSSSADGEKKGGQDILLCGYAGLEGTLRMIDEAEEELGTRFVSAFLEQAKELRKDLVMPEQLLALWGATRIRGGTASYTGGAWDGSAVPGVTAMRQITGGGILAVLWELSEFLDTGFEINLSAITLKQETVEICEFYRLNPYQMTSAGSFLIVTEDAEEAVNILEGAGARAIKLGVTKARKARVITSGEEVRYLDRPAPDELVSWMAQRCENKKFI